MNRQVDLSLDGQLYTGWKDVAITRSLDSVVGTFNLALSARERTEAKRWPLRAGARCKVNIDGEQLIDGWIDKLSPGVDADSHDISISGRDRAADLVDSSAVHKSGSWRNVKLEDIARELAKPFGVTLVIEGDTGAKIKKIALQQGESPWSAIERLARYRGLLAWSLADGSVKIGNPGKNTTSIAELTEGKNILFASAQHDVADRFSEYIIKGQASGDDEASGKTVSQVSGSAKDPAITRYRPLIIIAEEQSTKANLETRAKWEANVRAARSQSVTVSVKDWHAPTGKLWSIDNQVKVDAPSIYVKSQMMIAGVTFIRNDERGTVSDLQLALPEAYQQLPVSEKADASAIGGRPVSNSNAMNRMMAPLMGRVKLMVGRAIIRFVDDAKKAQELQLELLDGESQDGVERFQEYGFTSVPHDGAEAIAVFPGGLRSHGIVIACEDRRYRLKNMKPGEVALYDDLGNVLKLGRDAIEITAVTAVNVISPKVVVASDDIHLGGEGGAKVARVGDSVAGGVITSGSDKVNAA